MSAMNGSLRRMVGVALALALLASAALASSASAAKKSPPTPTTYIALGDSISFGYKEATKLKDEETNAEACAKDELSACVPPSSFEGGFVGDFGEKLAKEEKKADHTLSILNMACPGETSGGLIGNGPLGTGIEESREAKSEASLTLSAPCGWENVSGLSLKTPLGGHSELEAAVSALALGSDVTAVTINIGSNDELGVVAKCEEEAYREANGFKTNPIEGLPECLRTEVSEAGHAYPGGLFTHILTNIGVTIGTLRAYGYGGPIVILGFYNPQALKLHGSDALQEALNEHLEAEVASAYGAGVKVAKIFAKFNPGPAAGRKAKAKVEEKKGPGPKAEEAAKNAEQKAEEKAVCKYTEMCNAYDIEKTKNGDIHPTEAGYALMAKAVASAYAEALAELAP